MTRLDDLKFDFHGQPGKEYLMFDNGRFRATSRMTAGGNDTCFCDRVTVKTSEHTVQVSHDGVLIDGKPPLDVHRKPGDWVWVEDKGVAVGIDGWLVGVILDKGSDEVHRGGVLENVPHVSLFLTPPIDPSWEGLMATGSADCMPEVYEV